MKIGLSSNALKHSGGLERYALDLGRGFAAAGRHGGRAPKVDVLLGCNRVDSSDIAICGGTHLGFLRATGRPEKRSDSWQIALERRQYEQSSVIVAHSQLMHDELRELYGVEEA